MAKDKQKEKEHKIAHGVYKAGDKFHCGECSTEVHYGKNCPTCQREFDWTQIEAYRRWG